jgi:predicted GNAT superfamily acetyltransferase
VEPRPSPTPPPTHPTAEPRLRPIAAADEDAVLRLNTESEHLLSPMGRGRLHELLGWAHRADIIEVDRSVAGFVLCFAPGTAYDSENYRWFGEQYGADFYYLDRIAIDPAFRRRGLAAVAYAELEEVARAYGRMVLEINVDPPNDASLAFHAARGYREVHRLGAPGKRVALMEKPLWSDARPRH